MYNCCNDYWYWYSSLVVPVRRLLLLLVGGPGQGIIFLGCVVESLVVVVVVGCWAINFFLNSPIVR